MLAAGWQNEVTQLLPNSPENSKPFDFLGYKELAAVNRNDLSLAAARAEIQQSTRRYAKRQLTWFRREKNVQWFPNFGDHPDLQRQVLSYVGAEL